MTQTQRLDVRELINRNPLSRFQKLIIFLGFCVIALDGFDIAIMGFIALFTGSMWGRPTWGTYWVWDARLTSMLILFFLYLGYIALHTAFDDWRKADRAAAVIAIVGALNVPIIYFSVRWWNTLHQGASITTHGTSMETTMFYTVLTMVAAMWIYCTGAIVRRARTVVLERYRREPWARAAAAKEA